MQKTLQIDLDGVLNTYCGVYNEFVISPPREGAHDFLEELAKNYKVEIFTVRNAKLVVHWLIANKLDKYIANVTNVKNPYASVILDDRALRFEGNYNKTLSDIINFQPYWKK